MQLELQFKLYCRFESVLVVLLYLVVIVIKVKLVDAGICFDSNTRFRLLNVNGDCLQVQVSNRMCVMVTYREGL